MRGILVLLLGLSLTRAMVRPSRHYELPIIGLKVFERSVIRSRTDWSSNGGGARSDHEQIGAGTEEERDLITNRSEQERSAKCPPSEEDDVSERFACPTPDRMGRYRCIDDHVLCDGFVDCPGGEDEDRLACMFYKTTKAHLDILADALLRWARGR